MSAPPGVIRFAVRLMWSVPLFGLLVTAVNGYAVYVTARRLPTAPVDANAEAVPAAVGLFGDWAWQRTLVIAAGFVAATLVIGPLAMAVRRGSRRNPAAVMVLSGMLAVAFGLGCLWVWANDPVVAFRNEWIDVPGQAALSGVPWIMPLVAPGWYRPALGSLLGAAAAAQLLAVLLVTRTRAGVYVTGLGIQTGDDPDAGDAGTRRAARLLAAQPAFVLAYAGATALAVRLAAAANTDGYPGLEAGVQVMNLIVAGVVLLFALPSSVHGIVLLRRHRRATPLALAVTGGFSVLYLLLFWYVCGSNAATPAFFPDDQSLLLSHIPPWHVPALYGAFALAALTQLTALTLLSRNRLPY